MFYSGVPAKLEDISGDREHPSELILVEGESAAKAVIRLRDRSFQAVLPMQGKPLNAWKASRAAVNRNPWMRAAIDSVLGPREGIGNDGLDEHFRRQDVRYDRIVLLFDPDADGIHCGALMLMFFYRWMRPLLDAGQVIAARAPLYEIRSPDGSDVLHAFTDDHYQKLKASLDEKQIAYSGRRYRGLAAMNDGTLIQTCLNVDTRRTVRLGAEDARTAINVFCAQ